MVTYPECLPGVPTRSRMITYLEQNIAYLEQLPTRSKTHLAQNYYLPGAPTWRNYAYPEDDCLPGAIMPTRSTYPEQNYYLLGHLPGATTWSKMIAYLEQNY